LRRISLRQLIYLVELKRCGGFGRAAQALAISQPTLSHQIAQLEATLGVILVERGTRLLRLTARGELLAARASRILGLLDETIDLLDSHDDKKELRIGIPSYMSYPAVTELLASFREVARDAQLFLVEMTAEQMSDKLNEGEIDAGFLSLPTPDRLLDEMISLPIWEAPYLICLPKRHPLAGKPALHAKDLEQLDIVLAPREYHRAHYDHQLEALRALGIVPRIVHADVATTQSQMALTAAGVGACLLSEGANPILRELVLKKTEPALCNHRLALFWSPANRNALLERFVAEARLRLQRQ